MPVKHLVNRSESMKFGASTEGGSNRKRRAIRKGILGKDD